MSFMVGVHGFHGVEDGLGHHDEARPAAEGIVVTFAVLVVGPGADVVDGDGQEPILLGPAQHGLREGPGEHLREQGKDVNPQRDPPPSTRPP